MESAETSQVYPDDIRVIIGLGNPGSEYDKTRHNVGFEVLDILADLFVGKWKARHKSELYLCEEGQPISFLQKPKTFMNLSGEAVKKLCRKENIKPSQLLVIYDDLALKPGRLRIRETGSAGGHNGVKSMISYLGTQEFLRLRIGIGRPLHESSVSDYVLSPFAENEVELMNKVYRHAADAALMLCNDGCEAAMNKYNGDVSSLISSVTKSGENDIEKV